MCLKAARDRARKQVGNQQFNRPETQAGKIGNQQQPQQQPKGQKRNGSTQHQLEAAKLREYHDDGDDDYYNGNDTVNAIGDRTEPARHATLTVQGRQLQMELDTGSAHFVVDERVWKTLGSPKLTNAPSLTAYGGFSLSVMRQANVEVRFQGEIRTLNLVQNASTSLLGREWMQSFPRLHTWFDSAPINSIFVTNAKVSLLCKEFSDIFEPNLGKIKDYKAHIYVKPDAHFRFFKPRPVAFALREKIENDLDRLLKLGVIERV